jgi:lysophospholipase L1-like esterase
VYAGYFLYGKKKVCKLFNLGIRIMEERMKNAPVLIIGDSITEGFKEKELLPELNILNYGVSGDSTPELLERISKSWFDKNPRAAFLCIGTNDFARGRTDGYILGNIREIIDKIRSFSPRELKLVVISIFPTRDNAPRPNERIREFNRQLSILCKESAISYFDINRNFSDREGKLKSEFTEDGLHLTKAAYRLWADLISEYVGKL